MPSKAKKQLFFFAFRSLIRRSATLGDAFVAQRRKNSAIKIAKLLHLGIKKKRVSFVLRSIFRNFAPCNANVRQWAPLVQWIEQVSPKD